MTSTSQSGSVSQSDSQTGIDSQPLPDTQSMSGFEQVEDWILAWFESRGKIRMPDHENRDALRTTNYFDAAWLTSMEVVEFVTEIEQQFAMQFTDSDLQDSRFGTIGGVARLIIEHISPVNLVD